MKREDLENPEKMQSIIDEINNRLTPQQQLLDVQKEFGKQEIISLCFPGGDNVFVHKEDEILIINILSEEGDGFILTYDDIIEVTKKRNRKMCSNDEIEFFRDGKSLYMAALPEGSDKKLRDSIAEYGQAMPYDRFVIKTGGKIRIDSDDNTHML